jgi:hypothetical protein
MSIKHLGEIRDGNIIIDTVRSTAFENYIFSEKDGITTLSVATDMVEEYVEYMNDAWHKALVLLKDLCEQPAPRLTVSAIINAPVDTVWNAWNTPSDIMQWNHA